MELIYKIKRAPDEIISTTQPALLKEIKKEGISPINQIIKGENLQIMKTLLNTMAGKIDLIYIDIPFATNTIFTYSEERTSTISQSKTDNTAYQDKMVGEKYIEFIRERLIFLRELMADHASIYLHIDYKIGHYIKVIMDEIFGIKNFRNDITRIKCKPKNFKRKGYGNIKDLILFYTKTDNFIWNEPAQKMTEEEITRLFPKIDTKGKRYTTIPLHAPGETLNGETGKEWKGIKPPRGRHWRSAPSVLEDLDKQGLVEWSKTGNPRKILYAADAGIRGKKLQDIWDFKDYQYPRYPTEKNIDMLKTIIKASSDPGQLVLDCFSGSGTTLIASDELDRRWIGIDMSKAAIDITIKRINEYTKKENLFKKMGYTYLEQITLI
jgi:adenine-specific DNA-methyltransferase